MKKRFLAGLMVATMVSTMMFIPGCGSSKKKGTEITWMFWDNPKTSKDDTTKEYGEVIERFNKKFEGKYSCKIQTTNLEEYYTKLNSQVDSGKAPELFMCDPGPHMKEVSEKGASADMSAVLDSDSTWKGSFNEIFSTEKNGGIVDKEGKVKGLPICFQASCVYYNKEIFEKAGINEPPKTFSELLADCEKIKKNDVTPIGVACAAGDEWCVGMIAGYLCDREGGPKNLAGIKNKGEVKWDSPTYKAGFKKLKELSKYFQDTASSDKNDPVTQNFANGKQAMLVQGQWAIGQINGAKPDFADKYGIFAFPASDSPADPEADPTRIVTKTDNICLSAKAEGDKKDAAIELLKMFTNEETQKNLIEKCGKGSVLAQIDSSKASAQMQDLMKVKEAAKTSLGFYNEEMPSTEGGDKFNQMAAAVATGDKEPEDALKELDKTFTEKVWK